jgi:type I restriction enzyme, S subunit
MMIALNGLVEVGEGEVVCIVNNLEDLPDGWILTTLGDLGTWSSGGTPPRKESQYYDGDIPWIKTGDLSDGLLLEIEEKITPEGLKNSSAKIFPVNSLVVAMYGATIGRLGVLKIPAATNQACGVLLAQGITNQLIQYLFYYLLGSRETLRKIGKGGAQPNISQTLLKEFPCPLPPLNEQRRIVSTIEQLTDRSHKARAALADVPKLIAQFRQSVLAAAFRGDLTADWREKNPDIEPASELLERIKIDRRKRWEKAELEKMKAQGKNPKDDKWKERYKKSQDAIVSSLVSLPGGWTWIALDELASDDPNSLAIGPFGSNLKVVDYCSGGVPLVFVREIRAETFGNLETKFVTHKKATELKSHSVSSGDLLITKMGDPPGDTAIYPDDRPPAIITADCIKLSPDKRLTSPTFLKYWLRTQYLKKIILEETQGVAQQKLSLGRFREIAIPLPPIEEQAAIVEYLEKHLQSIENIQKLANQSQIEVDILDRSILAKAFRGELVPQDPNDEPAAVLLERIRAEREQTSTPKQRGKTTGKNSSKQLSIEGIE